MSLLQMQFQQKVLGWLLVMRTSQPICKANLYIITKVGTVNISASHTDMRSWSMLIKSTVVSRLADSACTHISAPELYTDFQIRWV